MIDGENRNVLEPTGAGEPPVPGSGMPTVDAPPDAAMSAQVPSPHAAAADGSIPTTTLKVVDLLNLLSQHPGDTTVSVDGWLVIDGKDVVPA